MEVSNEAKGSTPNVNRPMKLLTSVVIWYGSFAMGLSASFLGTTLLQFSENYPLAPSLVVYFGIAVIVGFSSGGFDTAHIVWLIDLWSGEAAPYIQVQHFSFALGTFVSPLIIRPFLAKREVDQTLTDFTNSTTNDNMDPGTSEIWIPFLIVGSSCILGGVAILGVTCLRNFGPCRIGNQTNPPNHIEKKSPNTSYKIQLIMLACLIVGTYVGMEITTVQFLPTFTHFIPLKLAPSDGAKILTGLSAAFMSGRAVGIFLVLKIRPEIIIVGNFVVILVGNIALHFVGGTSLEILWSGAVLLGVGFSAVFPCFYGFLEKHLHVTDVIGAVIISSSGLISAIYPVIIGTWIEQNPYVLMYTNYGSLLICWISFGAMYWIIRGARVEGYVGGKEEHGAMIELKMKEIEL
ncbi:Sodium-dependent glucose transporter 1 [Folsomia candida]|uniref:Sodium-dependent glucose transporter 1 n=1 Tax=Folsomia candida TaxID=158441 RepID=A0A226EV50_FOLCA|nr:Sodium-dependent glucose transporter 1 [Folsomia candida]